MQALKTLEQKINFPPAGTYVVAVSGGVDSLALLHMLASRQQEQQWRLLVAHFNHNMRSDSHVDQRLVRDIARIYDLPFHTATATDILHSEDAARRARYEFLTRVVAEYEASGIVTAHHFDDRQETSIFNLLRGAERQGAASLKTTDQIWRPLLNARKDELIAYAQYHGLPWREDATNQDITLTRNFLRHELLPSARSQAAGFDDQYSQTLGQLDVLNAQIDGELKKLIRKGRAPGASSVKVSRQYLQELKLGSISHLLVYMVRLLDPAAELSSKSVKELTRFAKTGVTGKEKTISLNIEAVLTSQDLVIARPESRAQHLVAQELLYEGSVRFGEHQLSYGSLCLDTQHPHIAAHKLKVRRALPGDRVAPLGMDGTKKLQDLFINAKIDRSDRAAWPVVARVEDNQVIWVPRLAVSRLFCLKDGSQNTRCITHEMLGAAVTAKQREVK